MSEAPVEHVVVNVAVERARAALSAKAAPASMGLWLLISLGLFVLSGSDNKVFDSVLLVVVIGIHEAGHALAMKVFGYRDLKIFFVPFFGGAASGKKTGAPVWQQCIVLFGGPLPGIAIGGVLAIVSAITKDSRIADAALQFVFINAFNLLPFAPLDGGRLIELALLGRHRWLATAFGVLSGLVLIALAFFLEAPGLGFMAVLALVSFSYRAKLRENADALRATLGTLPSEAAEVNDDALAALDDASVRMHPEAQAASRPTTIRNLWDTLAVAPPSGWASFAIFATWGAAVIATTVVVIVLLASNAIAKGDVPVDDEAVESAAPAPTHVSTPASVE